MQSSTDQIAAFLLKYNSVSNNQGKNAFAALLILPEFESLRFHRLLKRLKTEWNMSIPRYVAFRDPMSVFISLWRAPLDWTSSISVRNRLISVWRIFGSFRFIDLQRTLRIISHVDDKVLISVRCQQKQCHLLEQVMKLPRREISPMCLLMRYVRLTGKEGKPQGPLLLQSYRSHTPFTSNTIGGITRRAFHSLGKDTKAWGPHTTRGRQ